MLLDADQTGLLDLDEFVNGCMQLHGPAKSLQAPMVSARTCFQTTSAREFFCRFIAESLQVAKMSYENKRL